MVGSFVRRSGFWVLDFIKGGQVYKHYKDISDIMGNTSGSNNNSAKHLENLLQYATENTKFYKQYSNYNSISDFPVTNKIIIRNNIDEIVSNEFRDKDLYVVSTSGSTGIPFVVKQNKNKRNRVKADLIYFCEKCNYLIGDKYLYLRVWSEWKSKSAISRFKQNLIPVDISHLDENKLKHIRELLEKDKRITCIIGYAKSLDIVARYLLETNTKINNVRIVISSAEVLTKDMKERIKKAFNCNVVSRYANEEIGFLAQQPIDDDYFIINDASNYVEFLKLDSDEKASPGELCRVIVTDLFNYATPLIRYDTGDLAVYKMDPINGRVITEIQGRKADFIFDTVGNRLVSYSITNKMERFSGVKQFQLIQEGKKDYRLLLKVWGKTYKEDDIRSLLNNILGEDANIIIDYVDSIEALSSGKYKTIICNYKPTGR